MSDNELLLEILEMVNKNSKYLEKRIDNLDKKIEQVEKRLNARIDKLDNRLSKEINVNYQCEEARMDVLEMNTLIMRNVLMEYEENYII